jgi:hypothetical protein
LSDFELKPLHWNLSSTIEPTSVAGICRMPDHQRDTLLAADASMSRESGSEIDGNVSRGMESEFTQKYLKQNTTEMV